MPLNLEQKKELVKEVSAVLANADTVLTADYRGLTAIQLGEFRKIARKPGIHIKLVKNNMLKMALKDSEYSSVVENIFLEVELDIDKPKSHKQGLSENKKAVSG